MSDATPVPGLFAIEDWLAPEACEELIAAVEASEWSTQLRRRVQHYGHRYDYDRRSLSARGSSTETAPPIPPWAMSHARRLVAEGFMATVPDQAIVNEYHPGQGISAHVDCVPCFGPVVAAISLGSACVMDFTNPEDGRKAAIRLAPGSLCVMTGPARFLWRHGIAARKSDPGPEAGRVARGRRISVTYRSVL